MTMTTTDETVDLAPETEVDSGNDTGEPDKDNRDRDFTKYRKLHEDLANFVNANSGLDPITPNQVKAILYLRPDFNNTPEQKAERDARKARKAAEEAEYEGLTDEQKKAKKAAKRANDQLARMQERAAAAQAEAERVLATNNGAEDIASAVEQAQANTEAVVDPEPEPEPERKRGISRRNR